MQTLFVGPEHTQSFAFIPVSGDQPVADAHFTRQENAPVANQGGKQPFNRLFYFTVKRLLDLTLTLLALGLLWPLMLLIALAIKVDSSGPILVAQERVGVRRRRRHAQLHWEQRRFPLYKFRTTVATAKPAPTRKPGAAQRPNQRTSATTTVGRFLRQTSLDQLPQLWNILKGDLSLVGPRPVLPAELNKYAPAQLRRFETMPGMTGLWQLSDQRPTYHHAPPVHVRARQKALSFEQMVQSDLDYIEKQSLGLDVQILGNTFLAVLRAQTKSAADE